MDRPIKLPTVLCSNSEPLSIVTSAVCWNPFSVLIPLITISFPSSFSDVSANQLSGNLPTPFASSSISSGLFSAGRNFFTGPATVTAAGQPFCPSQQVVNYTSPFQLQLQRAVDGVSLLNPALLLNCLSYSTATACKAGSQQEVQRTTAACAAFCGASVLAAGPCGGNGVCFLNGTRSSVPACKCNPGFLPDVGTATVGGVTVSYPTCSINPTCENETWITSAERIMLYNKTWAPELFFISISLFLLSFPTPQSPLSSPYPSHPHTASPPSPPCCSTWSTCRSIKCSFVGLLSWFHYWKVRNITLVLSSTTTCILPKHLLHSLCSLPLRFSSSSSAEVAVRYGVPPLLSF